ncbi:hypothetical protein Tco_0772096 [Tanacetum coccineum]|uniref:Uncharacterized protein n=1 Tax=Tanacetum coccineum TaxID=301880 RepID=A0ABQ4ZH88_9ASTR
MEICYNPLVAAIGAYSEVHFLLFADGIYNVWVEKAKELLPNLACAFHNEGRGRERVQSHLERLFGRVMVIRRSRWRMGFEVVARSEQGALSAVECGAHRTVAGVCALHTVHGLPLEDCFVAVEKSMEVVQQSIKLSNLCLELRYRTLFREKDTNPVRRRCVVMIVRIEMELQQMIQRGVKSKLLHTSQLRTDQMGIGVDATKVMWAPHISIQAAKVQIHKVESLAVTLMILCSFDLSSLRCTKSMRADGGYGVIKKAIGKVEKKHIQHIAPYGEVNERRLTDKHKTANFKWGVANRGASIRESPREKRMAILRTEGHRQIWILIS